MRWQPWFPTHSCCPSRTLADGPRNACSATFSNREPLSSPIPPRGAWSDKLARGKSPEDERRNISKIERLLLGQRIPCVILELELLSGGFDEETGRDRAGTISSRVRRGLVSEENRLRRNPLVGPGHRLQGEDRAGKEVTNKNNNQVLSPGEKGREL
jgi:hypothetical protein